MPRWLITLAVAAIAAAGAAYYWHGGAQAQRPDRSASAQRTSIPVETAPARRATTGMDVRAIGSLRSDESVTVAPEIAGRIAEVAFSEGQNVRQGDVLVRLDDALAKAEVADAKARLELARSNFDRATELAKRGAGTERARDEATAAFETGRVALELAQVRLSKHTITAPFPGVVGLRSVSVGAFVNAGAALINLEKIDSLKVDFKIPELFLSQIRIGQPIEVRVDALPDRAFEGTIYAIDPQVDINGRALSLRARLPNAERALRPGLFARILIKGMTEREVVLVPESAIVPRGGETLVYRVENGKAIEAKVRLGQRKSGNVEILEGLQPDSSVVVAGHHRLRDGADVEIVTPVSDVRS